MEAQRGRRDWLNRRPIEHQNQAVRGSTGKAGGGGGGAGCQVLFHLAQDSFERLNRTICAALEPLPFVLFLGRPVLP